MHNVLKFWFEEIDPKTWYAKSDALDAQIRDRFLATYFSVVAGETAHWRNSAQGRLAEVIVLDQFARNMFRDSPQAFAADPLALALAQEAVRQGAAAELNEAERTFLYTPYMHSESRLVHEDALLLFADLPSLSFEERHKAIVDEFGRYPYRNRVLGRESTAAEVEWLATNSGF